MKKLLSIAFLALVCFQYTKAQSSDFANVKQVNLRNIGAMTENNEVIGYYSFFLVDKAGRNENEYALHILDNNLKTTHNISLKKSDKFILLEASFNGVNFCFSFVDLKNKLLEFMMYDKTGKALKSYIVNDLGDQELATYNASLSDESGTYAGGLHAVPGKGFIRCGTEKDKGARITIEMFDNTATRKWEAKSGATTKKSFETLSPLYTDKNYFITSLTTRDGMMAMDGDMFSVVFDVNTGKEKFRVTSKQPEGYLWPLGATADSTGIVVFGEYYAYKNDEKTKLDYNEKIGFYAMEYDLNGNLKQKNFSTWKGDVNKFMPVNSKGKLEDGNLAVMIHKFVKTADNRYFAIGEQFKKALAAGAAVMGASAAKVQLLDMMLLEFDSKFKLTKIHVYDKEKTNINLPRGMGLNGTAGLGYVLKMYGWFDYVFTTQSSDRSTFNSVYVNYDRSVDEGSKYVIGNIALNKEKQLVNPKVQLKTKPTTFLAMPAKPGYIAVFEYYKKKKSASIHLEKLDM